MRISKQWIEQFVSLPEKRAEDLGADLTLTTVEVEEVMEQGKNLEGVVVGEILDIQKHPNADRLSIAKVDVGEAKPRQIVFGQMVVMEVGNKIPVALAPTVLPDGRSINKTKMRGEVSEGMLCLDQELGLQKEGVSIHFFEPEIKNGTPIVEALGLDDVIFDIDNKSMTHRPDLWGHYGVAREFAAMYDTTLKEYSPAKIKEGKEEIVRIDIQEQQMCSRYIGVTIGSVTVQPSPDWMQKRLMSVGINPINNIVDITNYVMFEMGQPMHAFDADAIRRGPGELQIVVRRANKGEKMLLLGGDEIELSPSMLVIADEKKSIALAGVKGGEESRVTDTTTKILFEAANFDALSVRRVASAIGIRTDASARFEKALDPHLPLAAMRRAVELVLELCPGAKVISPVADEHSFSLDQGPIHISAQHIRTRIGVDLSTKDIIDILGRLGFEVKAKEDALLITVPTWRATGDIAIPEDIIEEVARMYGYRNIPTTFPKFPIKPTPASPLRDVKKRMVELLAYELGYTEVYNYSFVSPEWLSRMDIGVEDHIELEHPLAKDRPFLRRSLIPNMLMNMEMNLHRFDAVRLFETGRGYRKEDEGPQAEPMQEGNLPGQDEYVAVMYAEKNVEVPFFEVAGALRSLADRLGITLELRKKEDTSVSCIHPGRMAHVLFGKDMVGRIAELHPHIQQELGIPYRTAFCEINLTILAPRVHERIAYRPLPIYPSVDRDIAFVVSQSITHKELVEAMQASDPLVVTAQLFDVYQGDGIEQGKKSMAYHLEYLSPKRTLTTEEAEAAHANVLAVLQKKFAAEMRK